MLRPDGLKPWRPAGAAGSLNGSTAWSMRVTDGGRGSVAGAVLPGVVGLKGFDAAECWDDVVSPSGGNREADVWVEGRDDPGNSGCDACAYGLAFSADWYSCNRANSDSTVLSCRKTQQQQNGVDEQRLMKDGKNQKTNKNKQKHTATHPFFRRMCRQRRAILGRTDVCRGFEQQLQRVVPQHGAVGALCSQGLRLLLRVDGGGDSFVKFGGECGDLRVQLHHQLLHVSNAPLGGPRQPRVFDDAFALFRQSQLFVQLLDELLEKMGALHELLLRLVQQLPLPAQLAVLLNQFLVHRHDL